MVQPDDGVEQGRDVRHVWRVGEVGAVDFQFPCASGCGRPYLRDDDDTTPPCRDRRRDDRGGAIGNVMDRLRLGAVVDFIHLHVGGWNWFVFNIADMAIDVGVALWILDRLILDRQARCDA